MNLGFVTSIGTIFFVCLYFFCLIWLLIDGMMWFFLHSVCMFTNEQAGL